MTRPIKFRAWIDEKSKLELICDCPNCHQAKPEGREKAVDELCQLIRQNKEIEEKVKAFLHPTITEQKGEWEEEFTDRFLPTIKIGDFKGLETMKEIKSFIAAKKKEWEAQKEQAVKAEIREDIKRLKKVNDLPYRDSLAIQRFGDYNQALDDVSSLLSDKVNH